jgi:hypothetical protein
MCSKNHDTEGFECYHQEVWTATQEVSMPFTSPSFADDMMYAKTMSYTFLSLNLSIHYTLMLQCVMIFLSIPEKFCSFEDEGIAVL